jgi:hypothetical protein
MTPDDVLHAARDALAREEPRRAWEGLGEGLARWPLDPGLWLELLALCEPPAVRQLKPRSRSQLASVVRDALRRVYDDPAFWRGELAVLVVETLWSVEGDCQFTSDDCGRLLLADPRRADALALYLQCALCDAYLHRGVDLATVAARADDAAVRARLLGYHATVWAIVTRDLARARTWAAQARALDPALDLEAIRRACLTIHLGAHWEESPEDAAAVVPEIARW